MFTVEQLGAKAKKASQILACASTKEKDKALSAIADALIENTDAIIEKNKIDLENGKKNGLSSALLDRLLLDKGRIEGIAQAVREIVSLPDPVGKVIGGGTRPNGLQIVKKTVPLGVIAIIYEARPNVTADAATLCFKAGNAVVLRGGKEAINSNKIISDIMRQAVEKSGLPADCICFVEDTTRESSTELMQLTDYIDVLIPRGGAGLIKAVVNNSKVPVIETGAGTCHTFVDEYADIDMATEIVFNAKTSRPSVCNACECLLVHKSIAEKALPKIKEKLDTKNVEMRGDEKTCEILKNISKATDEDWGKEYGDYIIAVKVVNSIDEAIEHINKYGTGHSECIVSNNYENVNKFQLQVDAAAVYANASTRFTDGGEFGFAAEIGISTQKLHARGPLGLPELTSTKYIINGNGQIR
ncbi:MAG: glutamate-5-semialdehyde dehydrogenase [Clostridiales bacterium]|nr:glutamate-5-semialdehyde dehydrogenase [Clostridiales bacterium]